MVGGGGLQDLSVSPRPLGFGLLGFWAKVLGPGLDNKCEAFNRYSDIHLNCTKYCNKRLVQETVKESLLIYDKMSFKSFLSFDFVQHKDVDKIIDNTMRQKITWIYLPELFFFHTYIL